MPLTSVLVTGATGFVGGRLIDALLPTGRHVRALTRDASRLNSRDGLGVVEGDVLDAGSLRPAMEGIDLAYYLVHSLGSSGYADTDRRAAETFAAAAAVAGVQRIVYLSGIGRSDLSPHVRSRQEVGRILRESTVPTIEMRASIVIGDGSASYDAFRFLIDMLPAVALPDWARNPSQPIAADDVIAYLLQAAEIEVDGSPVFEIGGADRVPYVAILEEYARQSGRKRAITTVPTPAAAATVAALTRPIQPERARLVTDMIDSLQVDTSVADTAAAKAFSVQPVGLVEAVAAAM